MMTNGLRKAEKADITDIFIRGPRTASGVNGKCGELVTSAVDKGSASGGFLGGTRGKQDLYSD